MKKTYVVTVFLPFLTVAREFARRGEAMVWALTRPAHARVWVHNVRDGELVMSWR